MKNIAVLVSGGGTNLQAIMDALDRGEITGGKIKAVISNKDCHALERAEKAGIKTYIIRQENNRAFSQELKKLLDELNIDLVVLAGFLKILTKDVTSFYPNKIINVHPALIPSFCGEGYYGLKVHEKVLNFGAKVSGATIHFVTEDCDNGPIIYQGVVDIKDTDTPTSLQKRIMQECEWKLLPKAIDRFCNDKIEVSNRKVIIKED